MANPHIPPKSWRAKEISYDQLKTLHPVTLGIYVPEDEEDVKSIQVLKPNPWYTDSFGVSTFDHQTHTLLYEPSKTHRIGNAALERAYTYDQTFHVYCGYKRNCQSDWTIEDQLKEMKIPLKKYKGTSWDLGEARIIGKDQYGNWIIMPENRIYEETLVRAFRQE